MPSAVKRRLLILGGVSFALFALWYVLPELLKAFVSALAVGWMIARIGIFAAEAFVPDSELYS